MQAPRGCKICSRLLGCAAAVRAYRLQHGFYPATLSDAGVADLNHDPITGGTFVYRPTEQGFLLYSVGEDGVDDGGRRTSEHSPGKGDIGLLPFYTRGIDAGQKQGEAIWLK